MWTARLVLGRRGKLLNKIKDKQIPCIVYLIRSTGQSVQGLHRKTSRSLQLVPAQKEGITELKRNDRKKQQKQKRFQKPLVADLLNPSDFVVLVVPIDKAAPKGRLILPQQQTIRDILEAGAVSIVVKDNELKNTLENIGKKPKLVITDSQAFGKVSKDTPERYPAYLLFYPLCQIQRGTGDNDLWRGGFK